MGQLIQTSDGTSSQPSIAGHASAINCKTSPTKDELALSIDGIYLTVDLPSEATNRIHTFVAQMKTKSWSGIQVRHSRFFQTGFHAYLNGMLHWEPSGASAFVCETGTKRPGAKNTAFRWNPSKSSSIAVAGLIFNDYLNLPAAYLRDATVSRIDLALDVPHLRVDDIAASYPKMTLTESRFSAGRTTYLGATSGKTRVALYDKRAELIAANSKLGTYLSELKEPVPPHALMRIEVRLKPSFTILLRDLMALPNPFQRLRVHSRPANLTDLEDCSFDLARYEGLPRAVSKFKPAAKKAFVRKLIKAGAPNWWDPGYLWEKQLPPLMDAFLDPFANHQGNSNLPANSFDPPLTHYCVTQ